MSRTAAPVRSRSASLSSVTPGAVPVVAQPAASAASVVTQSLCGVTDLFYVGFMTGR